MVLLVVDGIHWAAEMTGTLVMLLGGSPVMGEEVRQFRVLVLGLLNYRLRMLSVDGRPPLNLVIGA